MGRNMDRARFDNYSQVIPPPSPVARIPAPEVEHYAWFDLNGDGKVVNLPEAYGGDGYLIADANGDGRIESGVDLDRGPVRTPSTVPKALAKPIAMRRAVQAYASARRGI